MKNVIVTLRVVRGKKITFNEDGTIANDNQPVKIKYDTVEWTNFMKYLHVNGYGRVTVEKAVQMLDDGGVQDIDFAEISKEVEKAFYGEEPELTPEQKIAEMQKQIDALKGKEEDVKEEPKVVKEDIIPSKEESPEIVGEPEEEKSLKDQYIELYGKRPHYKWSDEVLIEKIAAKK